MDILNIRYDVVGRNDLWNVIIMDFLNIRYDVFGRNDFLF